MAQAKKLTHRATPLRNPAFLSFILCFGAAFVLFLPYIIQDGGYFFFWADYNAQQIPFYCMAHDAVRAGEFGWNWSTDLGVNFIGSYSFYLIGSPFFWLTIPFPGECVPFLMAPLLMLKLAFSGLGAHLYLSRFVKSEYAVIGAVLYAFSGFSFYNLFYNHFHEAMMYLPFILYALERRMDEGKRGLFALFVCLSALNNYYFFFGQVIFLLLYWIVRLWSGAWRVTAKNIIGTITEAVLGTAGAGLLLLPSFFAVIQNSRTSDFVTGWDALIYQSPSVFWETLLSFFIPPGLAGHFVFSEEQLWSAPALWVPLFGCTGLIAYLQSRKHTDWLRRLWFILIPCLFIPLFNQAFSMFNAFYYGRWHYMPTLMLILATLLTLNEDETEHPVNWKRAFWWSGGITVALAILLLVLPLNPDPDEWYRNLIGEQTIFYYGLFVIAGCGLAVFGKLLLERKKSAKSFFTYAVVFCLVFALTTGFTTITSERRVGVERDCTREQYREERVKSLYTISLPHEDEQFFRIDSFDNNLGIFLEHSCLDAFHSIVPGSITDFYSSLNIERAMKSSSEPEHYGLRSLLSARYALDNRNHFIDEKGACRIEGWEETDSLGVWRVYENKNFIPMGFTYDSYLTRTEYDALEEKDRELALLKTLVVEDADEKTVSAYLSHGENADYTYEAFIEDCDARRDSASPDFTVTKHGFTATLTADSDTVAFFSVPFEKGWSATVNGKPAKILRTNVGFMSVAIPDGKSEITFTYETPGLFYGALISLAAWVLLALCLWLEPRIFKKRDPEK